MDTWVYIVGSMLAASVLSASGALLIVFWEESLDRWKDYLVALSIGAIFGGAFIHLIPRYASDYGLTNEAGLFIALSLLGSHVLERSIHWHCHDYCSFESYSFSLMAGDSVHNIIDGIIIAGSYLISIPAGVAATLAIVFHKIPKEIGDFGALIHGGVGKWNAVGVNVAVNVFGLMGAIAVILLSGSQEFIKLLIPLAIGNFIYVAGADLLPEIRGNDSSMVMKSFVIFAGIAMMYGVVLLKPFLI